MKDLPRCLHESFERVVERQGERPAVCCDGESLNYRQLNGRANQLAHHLIEAGVTPGTLVGLCVRRGLDTAVGVLGILKSGGAYVPLDPYYPESYLRHVSADAGVRIVVVDDHAAAPVGFGAARTVVLAEAPLGARPAHDPRVDIGPSSLMYVIYTSGSTGAPKGVMVTHANVSRLVPALSEHFNFRPDDTWTMLHSISFGFSVWEMWGAWLTGARLLMAPPLWQGGEELYSLVYEERVTVLSVTASGFRLLCDADEMSRRVDAMPLRYIAFSGEPLERHSLRSWFRCHDDDAPVLANMYALTETSGEVAFHRIRSEDVSPARLKVIGRPLSDVAIHVLDEYRRPVDVGDSGVLYVEGDCLARGYLGNDALTAERFIEAPLGPSDRRRLYRTGDRARQLGSGELELIGREDEQIKVRGHRVEPGEIESQLTNHVGVDRAVVRAEEVLGRDPRVVAYIVPSPSARTTATGARAAVDVSPQAVVAYLAERLPAHMVPASIVAIDAVPTLPNGKIDKGALPEAPTLRPSMPTDYAAPEFDSEKIVCGVFEDLLRIKGVGTLDDFFELGGDSLLAMQAVARLRDVAETELSVRDLFYAPTVRQLVLLIAERQLASHGTERAPGRS